MSLGKKLQFDLVLLQEMSDKLADLSTDLKTLDTDLQKKMNQLKKDWNTPAGKNFFEEQDLAWSDDVAAYVAVLETLKEMVDFAISTYSEVESDVKSLSI